MGGDPRWALGTSAPVVEALGEYLYRGRQGDAMSAAGQDIKTAMTWWKWLTVEIRMKHPKAKEEEIYRRTKAAMKRMLNVQERRWENDNSD